MVFTKDFDNKTRFLVLFQDVTKTASRISKYLSISESTIYRWISQIENDEDIFVTKPGRGRKKRINEELIEEIIGEVESNPHGSSTRKLGAQFNLSNKTIHKILKDEDLKYQAVEKPTHHFTRDEKDFRVQFCREMLEDHSWKITQSFYADEMGIKLNDCYSRKVWSPPGKKVKVTPPDENVKLNCWGAISMEGATPLYIYKQNLNSDFYKDILEEAKEEMEELYPEGFNFIHDNYAVHQAAEEFAEEIGYEFTQFPTYSPDLNPIENLWATLKSSVRSDNPRNEDELKESLKTNWERLATKENLQPYFETLTQRYETCIEKKGVKLEV
jgi:transposase